MTRLRCLVVDDEPHARQRMVDLLADEHDVDVVACCADGRDAIERIADLQPDLVFLDIEMPGADGFAVVEAIPTGQLPEVVFVTAYDKFAVRAFEVNAIDYLLKPVDRARFARCVARCRARLASQARPSHEQLSSLLRFRRDPDAPAARVVARRGDDVHFHDPDQIDWVEAAGNYLRVHVGDEVSLVRDTMARMHRRLADHGFLRVHRSALVNLRRIDLVRPHENGEFELVLRGGATVRSGRRYREAVTRLRRGPDRGSRT